MSSTTNEDRATNYGSFSKCSIRQLIRICFILMFLALPVVCHAAEVTVGWDLSADPDIAGYEIHYGETSGNYLFSVDVGQTNSYEFTNVQEDQSYYVAAAAYDIYGNKSDFSEELAFSSITASADEYGTISPADIVVAVHNSSKTFHMSSNPNCRLVNVIVDDTPLGPVSSYTFDTITTPHRINAIFEPFTTWYVNKNKGYSGDGRSWSSAFTTIQEAVDAAQDGDDIWVAGAVEYQLSQPVEVYKEVRLYGGFIGNETSFDQRNWNNSQTLINGSGQTQCFIVSADATIDGFFIQGGMADFGGAILITSCKANIVNCRFSDNQASWGGGIYAQNGTLSLQNSEFRGNRADWGGAIYGDSVVVVVNCTFVENTASLSGGALAISSNGNGSVINSILWKDVPQEIDDSGGTIEVAYSIIQGGYVGQGNLADDPVFANLADGDLRLSNKSPCLDAGIQWNNDNDSTVQVPLVDLSGKNRVSDGNGDGVAIVDMGAFEYQLGSGISTTGVFRPSTGLIYLKKANSTGWADKELVYGLPGDFPIVGDWDGDGVDTIGIYRNGVFYLQNSNETGYADKVFAFGADGDLPVAGDWDGDGVDTIGVYRDGLFMLRDTNDAGSPDMEFSLGIPGDVPIAGNWDGIGGDSVGVFRPTNGLIYLKNENSTGYADTNIVFGIPFDKPVVGDWDGDGIDTIGVYREGIFLLRNSNTTGYAEMSFGLGVDGDVPISGKWSLP